MPRDIQQAISSPVGRDIWIQKQEAKAQRRRPVRIKAKPRRGTLAAKRNRRMAIREAALRHVYVVITYKKITTGETKKYRVAPYSWRYRRLRVGMRKLLFAYDKDDKHIKGFVWRNVQRVALSDTKFRPKWPIEIV